MVAYSHYICTTTVWNSTKKSGLSDSSFLSQPQLFPFQTSRSHSQFPLSLNSWQKRLPYPHDPRQKARGSSLAHLPPPPCSCFPIYTADTTLPLKKKCMELKVCCFARKGIARKADLCYINICFWISVRERLLTGARWSAALALIGWVGDLVSDTTSIILLSISFKPVCLKNV